MDLILKVTKILNLSLQCTEYVMSENKRNTLTVGASEFFIKFKNLVTLNLSGIHIDEQASSGLASAFEGMQSLEHLIMNGCCLTSGVVIELLQALLRSSKLKEFHACSNSICDNATEALGIAILHWKSLRILNVIENNQFTESGKSFLKFLLTYLHDNKCDRSLCISGISIKAFVTIMNNPTLQVKNLEMLENLTLQYFDNRIELDVYACKVFYRLIHLKELHLTNIIITSEAVFVIAYVLACKLDSLQTLTLCNCGLDSKNVVDIISTQTTAKPNAFQNLKELDLSCNNITDKAVLSLITSFLQMPKFTKICMSDNPLVNYNIKEIEALLNDFKSSRSSIKYVSSHDNKHGLLLALLTLLGCMKNIDAAKSCQIKNFTMINELNIQNLHSKKVLNLTKNKALALARVTGLIKLYIKGICIKPSAVDIIADCLARHFIKLKEFMLSNCQLDSDAVLKLLKCNKEILPSAFKTLNRVNFDNNNITEEATEPLITSILKMASLYSLSVDNNPIRSPIFKKAIDIALQMNDYNPYYSNDDKSVDYVNAFIGLLNSAANIPPDISLRAQNIMKLKVLRIACFSRITLLPKSILFLNKLVDLEELNVSKLRFEPEVIDIIASALGSNLSMLTILNLSDCQLTSNHVITLLCPCKSATLSQLTEVDLSHNKIKDGAIYSVIESLLQIPKLTKVNFHGNSLSDSNLLAINRITTDFNSCMSVIEYSNRADKYMCISSLFTILSSMKNVSEKRSYQVKNILTVSKIILNTEVSMIMTEDVIEFFCNFIYLRQLNLDGICISNRTAFATALKSYESLDTLVMNRCRLDSQLIYGNALSDNKATVLADGLVCCKCLQHLNLSNNNITDQQAASKLMTSFLQMNSLTKLHVENNPGETMMKAAFDIIKRMREPQHTFVASSNNEVKGFLILLSSAADISPFLSLSIHNLTNLKKLQIQCSSCVKFRVQSSLFFEKFTKLEELSISGVHIELQAINVIADKLPLCLGSLKVLDLSNCQLDSNDAIALLSPCKSATLPQLTEFNLSHNKIGNDAIYSVIESLLQIPKLSKIKFDGNPLSDSNLLAINRITTDFNSCMATIDYSDRVDKYIYISSLLTILSGMKNVSEKRSYQVNNTLTVNNMIIQILYQEVPMVMSVDVLVFLCRFNNLEKLNLNGIYINNAADCTALKSYESLDTLIINKCRLYSHFVTAVVSSVRKDKLRELCLSQTENIDHRTMCAINKLMNCNEVLTILNLSGNAFSDKEATVLADGLVGCKNLQHLDLSNNKITNQATFELLLSFLQMDKLKVFHCENNPGEGIMKPAYDINIELRRPQESYVISNDEAEAFLIFLCSAVVISPSVSLPVQNFTNIKKLSILCSGYVKFTMESSLFFQKFAKLEELRINGLCIESKAISVIADTLPNNLCSLKVLDLSNCQLNSSNAIHLLSPCKSATLPQLTEVNLSHNNIKDDAIYSVIESLLQIPKLIKVSFNDNPLSDSNLLAINHITTDFDSCMLTIDYSDKTDKDIYSSSTLTILSSMNNVSNERCYQVKNILTVQKICLQCLGHHSSIVMTEDVSLFFCRLTNLRTLNLSGISIELSVTEKLATALSHNLYLLEILELNHCSLSSQSVAYIVRSLNKEMLKQLCLSDNITKCDHYCQAEIAIKSFIENNNTLTYINLSSNHINSRRALELANGFSGCSNLQKLDLSYNNVTDEAVPSLIEGFLQMPKLVEICMDNNQFVYHDINMIVKCMEDCKCFRSTIKYISRNGSDKVVSAFLTILSCMKNVVIAKSCQVKNITKITELNLQYIHSTKVLTLTENAVSAITRFIELKKLELSGICIKAGALNAISNALVNNLGNSLEQLTSFHCQLNSESILTLFKKQECVIFPKLINLNLSNNNITDTAVDSLVTALFHMPKLVVLDINGNLFKEFNIK